MDDRSTRTEFFWLAWYATSGALLALTMLWVGGESIGQTSDPALELTLVAVVWFLVMSIVLLRRSRTDESLTVAEVVPLLTACATGLLLLSVVRQNHPPAMVVAAVLGLAFGAVACVVLTRRAGARGPALVGAFALTGGAAYLASMPPKPETRVISTQWYDFIATYIREPFPEVRVTGGALATFGDGYLLVTGDGTLYALDWSASEGTMDVRALPHRVPINRASFEALHPDDVVKNGRFRVGDLMVEEGESGFRLFVSHHYWHDSEGCFTVRISSTVGSHASFIEQDEPAQWDLVYETDPCLSYSGVGVFGGLQLGGKMEPFGNGRLLFAVGDQRRDGVVLPDVVSQSLDNSYGKLVVVDHANDTSHIYSRGHRNPQGLHIDAQGNVWATEHGPQGGDELNLIREGGHYGWPLVTYGSDYNRRVWPLSRDQGRHTGFDEPAYAWIPSIGVTSVTSVQHEALDMWRGDLLVGTLRNQELFRVRLVDQRIGSIETIPTGARVRDVVSDSRGRLVIWSEGSFTPPTTGSLVVLEPLNEASSLRSSFRPETRGEILFAAQCSGCHSVAGSPSALGPALEGVVGRRIAAPSTGFSFSPALTEIPGSWTAEELDGFRSRTPVNERI